MPPIKPNHTALWPRRLIRVSLRLGLASVILYVGIYLALRALGFLRYHGEYDTLFLGRELEISGRPVFQIWDRDFRLFYLMAKLDPTNSYMDYEMGTRLQLYEKEGATNFAIRWEGVDFPNENPKIGGSWYNDYGEGWRWMEYDFEVITEYCNRILQGNGGGAELHHHRSGESITPLQMTGSATVSLTLASEESAELRIYFLDWDKGRHEPGEGSRVLIVLDR